MPTKQDIDKDIAVNMGGTVPPGHALGPVRQRLLDDPRERQWVIGQVISGTTSIKHPAEARDQRAPTLLWVEMVGVTDTAACDQLAAVAARARARKPGQARLDDTPAGDPGSDDPGEDDDE